MSGVKTVADLIEILSGTQMNDEQKALMAALNVRQPDGKMNPDLIEAIRDQNKVDSSAIVFATESGGIKFETKKTVVDHSGKTSDFPRAPMVQRFPFSVAKINEIIEAKSLTINEEKIKTVLEKYIEDLPKSVETYQTGSVIVKRFKDVNDRISSLLSAGTKVLDSILYMAYKGSDSHAFIFSVSELSPETIESGEIAKNISLGNKALKAAFCCVYNQGGLPSESSDQKTLSKFIRETIFKKSDLTSNDFCKMLSCVDPALFPAAVFLNIKIENLPTEVSSRCKMSIAGNKAIRYAILAKRFEEMTLTLPTAAEGAVALDYMKKMAKLEKAKAITNELSSLASDPEAQKCMHPLNPRRSSRKNFTLQLTCAIVHSLSVEGRNQLREHIEKHSIAAFKRDDNIYGITNTLGFVSFPILTNAEADFSELSVDSIRLAYSVKK